MRCAPAQLVAPAAAAASTSGRPMQVHRLRPARTSQVSARVQEAPLSSWVALNRRLDRAVGRLVWYERGTRQSRSKTPDTPLREVPTPPINTAQHDPSITRYLCRYHPFPGHGRADWAGRGPFVFHHCVPYLVPTN
ncbi:hypothetical protein HYQ44_008156 [Verticillium longisporum]|nr:hypothetical protein HYQ44_008156 [Verticillium longisporum]